MKRIIGMAIGLGYFGIVTFTFGISRQGWADGNPDIGFWFAVVSGFLTLAGIAALLGTWMHTQPTGRWAASD